MSERIGDVRSQAATLHAMADVRGQRGEVAGALEFYGKSLEMNERIGDVRGQATTLTNMAGIAFKAGDRATAAKQTTRAVRLLEQAQAYSNLVTTLGNLSVIDEHNRLPILTQAAWLAATLVHPSLGITATVLFQVVPAADPLKAALAELLMLDAARHPNDKDRDAEAMKVARIAAGNRGMSQDDLKKWIDDTMRNPAEHTRLALALLESSVPASAWLFDREKVKKIHNRGTMKAEAH